MFASFADDTWLRTEAAGLLGALAPEIWPIEAARTTAHDLVLVDLNRPRLDGPGATSQIRALEAEEQPESRGRCPAAGMDDLVSKQINTNRFAPLIGDWGPPTAGQVPVGKMPSRPVAHVDTLIRDLVPLYFAHRREDVDAIRQHLSDQDFSAIARLGHKMKGSGGGFGFPEVGIIGGALELAARDGAAEEIQHLTERLVQYLDRVRVRWVDNP